ncbi:hypothetical protein IGI04_008604 [Brassica rapa subsp. trilocularis]|uniref:Uncharacterized protein n=1 Tax=Brassica rapa subsp. trilocularis TaxID=1813537 RepID=A0ABQ7NQC4_BRACM|nr:hypothetical protein IGI04_008604 [Brassica rapa subsp. trilocularis]
MKLVFLLALTVVASCMHLSLLPFLLITRSYAREVPDKFPPGVTPDTPPFSYVTPPPPPPSNEETKFPPGVTPDTPPFSYVTPPPPTMREH